MDPDFPRAWPPGYPPHVPISARQARILDAAASSEFALPSLALMEHASLGVAALADRLAAPGSSCLCLCGPGNNGGDGYGAARILHSWGRSVRVLRCAPRAPSGGDAGLQYALAARGPGVENAHEAPQRVLEALEGHPGVVVDALFGVGLVRPLEEPFVGWIAALNAAPMPVLAVDVPSGMDSDTGSALPVCVLADVTATMAAPKTGLVAAPEASGVVVEVDIGLPRALHEAFLA